MKDATQESEIAQFLGSGDYDPVFRHWPGRHALERIENGEKALREALLAGVTEIVPVGRMTTTFPIAESSLPEWTRKKLEPMVRGLFRGDEQKPVLSLLSESVVFVTGDTIVRLVEHDASLVRHGFLPTCTCGITVEGRSRMKPRTLSGFRRSPPAMCHLNISRRRTHLRIL